jgi:hypothetical protein
MRSLWPVVRGSCDPIRSAESLVHKVRDHALSSVFQVVAVVHPNASVVCNEGDVVALLGQNVQRVDPPRTSGGWHTIASQHDNVMAMQVHRMHFAAVVLNMHNDDIARAHHVHRDVRDQVSVDRVDDQSDSRTVAWGEPDQSRVVPVSRTPAGPDRRRVAAAPVYRRRGFQ